MPGGRPARTGPDQWQDTQREYESRVKPATDVPPNTISNLRHLGSLSGVTSYYAAGCGSGSTGTRLAVTPTASFLRAFPLICPPYPSRINELSFHIRTASASTNASIGAYRNAGEGNLFPGGLIIQSGAISTDSTGIKTLPCNILCAPGEILWLAGYNNSGVPVWSGQNRSTVGNTMIGVEDRTAVATETAAGHSVAWTSIAMPATFPTAGRLEHTGNFVSLFAHFAVVR